MTDIILFYINGIQYRRSDATLFHPLTTFLREELRLTGTKVVCAEGACGACTVLVGRPVDDGLRYQTLNACLLSLHQIAGCHVVTVEGVSDQGRLSPVQEALVAGHGAQCGFCTPGMVMTLTGICETGRDDLPDALSGNLCRCTGYLPILESARHIGPCGLSSHRPVVSRTRDRFGTERASEPAGRDQSRGAAFVSSDDPGRSRSLEKSHTRTP